MSIPKQVQFYNYICSTYFRELVFYRNFSEKKSTRFYCPHTFAFNLLLCIEVLLHIFCVYTLGWALFAWAAQELSVDHMGACCDIKKLKSTHINPALASHAEPKADIGLSV